MRVFIDADGCPVVGRAVQSAKRAGADCVIVCDASHALQVEGARTVTVLQGSDSADFTLVNMLSKGDILVTQDYGLAAMSLARGAVPVNQDGMVYTDRNIDALLSRRHLARKIRQAGGRVKGPAKRAAHQDVSFDQSLSRLLGSGG